MQFKLSAIALALVTLAAATPARRNDSPPTTCPTSGAQCCSTVENASSPGVDTILKSIGVDVSSITAQVGLGCSPITVVGINNGDCSTTAVYCEDNSHSSLISLGCIPITL
ncbi:hydrophobin 2 [Mycena floridula]|nr:hydrophobin 2 [Mycena floridula]